MNTLERIAKLKADIEDAQIEIGNIRNACHHDWQPSDQKHPGGSFPICALCGSSRHGWWCETSPTKECDYSRPNGRGYNPDDCRYCHQPDERK